MVLYVKLERHVVGVLSLEKAPSGRRASVGRPRSPRLRRNVKLGEESDDGLEAPLVGERRKIDTFHQRRTAFRPELRAIVMRIYVAGSLEAVAGIFLLYRLHHGVDAVESFS